ncbi:hypothetical protein ACWC0A_36080 [Streptomyces scopuliridis]
MARLQVMHLPCTPDGSTPFMLVIDEVEPLDVDFTDPKYADFYQVLKDETGARCVFATLATLDVA